MHNLKPDPVFFSLSTDAKVARANNFSSTRPGHVIHLIRSRFEIQVSAQNEKGINLGNPFGNQIVENEAETRLTISDRKGK